MNNFKIKDLLTDVISGEWGEEPVMGEGVYILRTTNFTNEGEINYSNVVKRSISAHIAQFKRLEYGDIIIEKSGGSPTQPVGRVVFFDKEETKIPYLCNNFTAILRPNKKVVHPKFLFYFLYQNHQVGNTAKFQNKTTGIINLKLESYLGESISFPNSLHQQKLYADILDKAKVVMKYRQKSIEAVDEFLSGIFGDILKNTKSAEKKIKLGQILKIDRKQVNPTEFNNYEFYVALEDIEKDTGIIITKRIVAISGVKSSKFAFTANHVLYGKLRPYLNKVSIPNFNGICSTDIFPILPINNSNKYFIAWILKSNDFREYAKNRTSGANLPRINEENILNYEIPFITQASQNQFASIANNANLITSSYIENLKELKHFFDSLLQKAFKGELEINESYLKTQKSTIKDDIDLIGSNQDKVTFENITVKEAEELIKNRFTAMAFTVDDIQNYFLTEKSWQNVNYDELCRLIFKWLDEGILKQFLFNPDDKQHLKKKIASIDEDPMAESKPIKGTTRKILLELA